MATSASGRLRPVLLSVEPHNNGDGSIMDDGDSPVPCLPTVETACVQTAKA